MRGPHVFARESALAKSSRTLLTVVNFACVAMSGMVCLGLYHVAEQTRVAKAELHHVNHQIVAERSEMTVLQAEWARVADPARIQRLAQAYLGLSDTPTIELSSLTLLPRRDSDQGPGGARLRSASAREDSAAPPASFRLASVRMRN